MYLKDTQYFPLSQLSHGRLAYTSRVPEGPGRVLEPVDVQKIDEIESGDRAIPGYFFFVLGSGR